MPTVLHIDGLGSEPTNGTVEPGESLYDLIKRWGGTVRAEYVPEQARPPRELSGEAADFIASYQREDPAAVLAVFWRYHSVEAEEFDTTEEAKRFIEASEEYGSLAGEAIVNGDQITVLD